MRQFKGHGFVLEADGTATRTLDLSDIRDIGGLTGARRAMADVRRYTQELSTKLDANATLSDDERNGLANARALATTIAATVTRAEAMNESERAEAARLSGGRVDGDTNASDRARRAAGFRTSSADDDVARARPAIDRTFAGMFGDQARGVDGWGDGRMAASREFCRAVALGLNDTRLRAASMDGNTGGAGGFAIPPAIFGRWLDQALESEIVRPRCQVWPITAPARERQVPAWDLHDRSSGIAGFAIDFEPENPSSDATPQVGVTRLLTLHARRGAIFASASNELVQDGLDFDQQLEMVMSAALGYGLDQQFLWGTGAPGPLGVFNSAALISVTRAVANQIDYVDLTTMFSRLSPASIPNSVWVAHSSTIPQLAALSIAIGTAGSHIPVMSESAGQFRILTRPVIFSEKLKPLGTLGDIGLFDFSRYAIGLRQDAALEKSIHVGFLKNQQYFRLQIRIDGQPVDALPTTPPNSAATQSAFVTLAA